ncbi:hypothetical protein BJX63DRAFT_428483 [Aspergillus granulosus]|uniref:Uncharacterized protein n=1 Tax=Aspergillus granulosus TaxID=176169 RepID=A0ABR4HWE7_9EURO
MESIPFGSLPFDHFVLENWDATSAASKEDQRRSLVERWIGLGERGRRNYFREELDDGEIPAHIPQDLCTVDQRRADADCQLTSTIWMRTWFGMPGDKESRAAADVAYKKLCFYALQQGDEDQDPLFSIRKEFMYDYYQRSDTPDISDGVVLGTACGLPDNDNNDLERYVTELKDTDQRLLFCIADRKACEEGWMLFLGINHRGQVLPFRARQKATLIEEDILALWEGDDGVPLAQKDLSGLGRDEERYLSGLDVTLDARFDMNARWAYYAQGTLVPLGIDAIYTYFELEPEVEAKIEVQGSAEMEYKSQRIKIIDTLSYPGFAIKGIAAVGPTLDLYGQMGAQARVAGTLTAGAKVTFPRYEMYFPQTPEAEEYQHWSLPASENEQRITGPEMRPILDASVQARVNLDFNVTPEVNLGIIVNSPLGKEDSLMDAQIVGFVNNTLRFEVEGQAKGGIGNPPAASYTVQIKYLYNFGIGGRAIFKWLGEHALDQHFGRGRARRFYGNIMVPRLLPNEVLQSWKMGGASPLLSNYSLPTE